MPNLPDKIRMLPMRVVQDRMNLTGVQFEANLLAKRVETLMARLEELEQAAQPTATQVSTPAVDGEWEES